MMVGSILVILMLASLHPFCGYAISHLHNVYVYFNMPGDVPATVRLIDAYTVPIMVGNILFTSGQFQYISIIGWSYLSHIFLIVWLYQYPCDPYSWEIQLLVYPAYGESPAMVR